MSAGRTIRTGAGRELANDDARQLAARLTWIFLLLDPIGHPIADLPLALLCLMGLLSRRLEVAPAMWWGASLLCALPVLQQWTQVDNHAFLRLYWTLALAVAGSTAQPRHDLARNARLLVGWAFLLALIWKAVLSPDFLDGRFMRFTFLTDARFVDASAWLGGLAPEDHDRNRALVGRWLANPDASWSEDFVEPARIRALAHAATVWTLLLEAAVALGFLWPARRGDARWRDGPLLLFLVTTYAVATVEGFGWLLCILGLAQCEASRTRVRFAYLGAFALILVYARLPWARLTAGLLGA